MTPYGPPFIRSASSTHVGLTSVSRNFASGYITDRLFSKSLSPRISKANEIAYLTACFIFYEYMCLACVCLCIGHVNLSLLWRFFAQWSPNWHHRQRIEQPHRPFSGYVTALHNTIADAHKFLTHLFARFKRHRNDALRRTTVRVAH